MIFVNRQKYEESLGKSFKISICEMLGGNETHGDEWKREINHHLNKYCFWEHFRLLFWFNKWAESALFIKIKISITSKSSSWDLLCLPPIAASIEWGDKDISCIQWNEVDPFNLNIQKWFIMCELWKISIIFVLIE